MAIGRSIAIEGLTAEQILELPREEFDSLILRGGPIVFRAGSATILGQFRVADGSLVIELGHIDGGGEGVLPTLASIARRYAMREGLSRLDWRVHAVTCPKPNLKLRRLLERRGFVVHDVPGSGTCYHRIEAIATAPAEGVAATIEEQDR